MNLTKLLIQKIDQTEPTMDNHPANLWIELVQAHNLLPDEQAALRYLILDEDDNLGIHRMHNLDEAGIQLLYRWRVRWSTMLSELNKTNPKKGEKKSSQPKQPRLI